MKDQVEAHRRRKEAVVDASETCYVDVYGCKIGTVLSGLHHQHLLEY